MTKTFDNTNRGSVWGNKDKKNENSATHQGKANITLSTTNLDNDPKGYNTVDNIEKYLIRDGGGDITGIKVDVFVNAWTRKAGANEKAPAMSFSFSPIKQQKTEQKEMVVEEFEDSSIPF